VSKSGEKSLSIRTDRTVPYELWNGSVDGPYGLLKWFTDRESTLSIRKVRQWVLSVSARQWVLSASLVVGPYGSYDPMISQASLSSLPDCLFKYSSSMWMTAWHNASKTGNGNAPAAARLKLTAFYIKEKIYVQQRNYKLWKLEAQNFISNAQFQKWDAQNFGKYWSRVRNLQTFQSGLLLAASLSRNFLRLSLTHGFARETRQFILATDVFIQQSICSIRTQATRNMSRLIYM
jgi:hypothetical protein